MKPVGKRQGTLRLPCLVTNSSPRGVTDSRVIACSFIWSQEALQPPEGSATLTVSEFIKQAEGEVGSCLKLRLSVSDLCRLYTILIQVLI